MDLHLSLPDDIQPFVEAQMLAEGYDSVDDYLLALIRQDQQRQSALSVLERMGGMPEHLLHDGNLSQRQVRRAKLTERIRAIATFDQDFDVYRRYRNQPFERVF